MAAGRTPAQAGAGEGRRYPEEIRLVSTLPPDLEGPLEEARRLGTTPELLARDSLRKLFGSQHPADPPLTSQTLFEFLSGHIGRVSGTTEALSENCGQRFAEGLTEKHRQGRL